MSRHLVDHKNVGMIQRRRGPRFLLEAAASGRVGSEGLGKNLDRDFAVEPGIVRAIYFAHSARTQR